MSMATASGAADGGGVVLAEFVVATVKRPDSVSQTARGAFTGPTDLNVIVWQVFLPARASGSLSGGILMAGKWTHLEVYIVSEDRDDMLLVADLDLPCRVARMELFRPPGSDVDHIFVATEKFRYFVARWDTTAAEPAAAHAGRLLVTEAHGEFRERAGVPVDSGRVGCKDPRDRAVALHMYKGLVRVFCLGGAAPAAPAARRNRRAWPAGSAASRALSGTLSSAAGEAFNLRIRELQVVDFSFAEFPGEESPVLVVLYGDLNGSRSIRAYKLDLDLREFGDFWGPTAVLPSSSFLAAIPLSQGGGILVSANQSLCYYGREGEAQFSLQHDTLIVCFDYIESDSFTEMVMADEGGVVYSLSLDVQSSAISLDRMGEGPQPTAITALGGGVVFIGSHFGDSVLVRLKSTMVDLVDEPSSMEVADGFEKSKIVACCGANKDGSLRVIRRGVGLAELANIELSGLVGMWSVTLGGRSGLVLSFLNESRIIGLDEDEEIGEVEISGFQHDSATLFAASVDSDRILQVTRSGARVIRTSNEAVVAEWVPDSSSINHADTIGSEFLFGLSGGALVACTLDDGIVVEKRRKTFSAEIACVDLYAFESSPGVAARLCAVGLWGDPSIHLLWLDTLEEAADLALGGEGRLVSFQYNLDENVVKDRKRFSLGLQPFELVRFLHSGKQSVFAASDRPTILGCTGAGRLTFSTLGVKDMVTLCRFPTAESPDALAIGTASGVIVGVVDDVQKWHTKPVHLRESPMRIAHNEASGCFGVLTSAAVGCEPSESASPEEERYYLRLFDDDSLEIIDSFEFDSAESAHSICTFAGSDSGTTFFAVGTAQVMPNQEEATRGRIMVFKVHSEFERRRVALETSIDVTGCVYSLECVKGRLVAAINNKVQVFRFVESSDGTGASSGGHADGFSGSHLEAGQKHSGFIQALYLSTHSDFVAVGDILNSVAVLQTGWEGPGGQSTTVAAGGSRGSGGVIKQLAEVARDYDSVWMTAVSAVDDATYVCGEASFNLFVLRRRAGAASEEERRRMVVAGQMHLGSMVNRFRK
ncbi:DNA damage-binding protein 1a, partial [Cladochytrium tenue]